MSKYLPRHDTQYEPRTIASPYDCNMSASADALRFYTLGLKDHDHDELRHASGTYGELTDGVKGNEGTNISEAAHALSHYGVPSNHFDASDGEAWGSVRLALLSRAVVVAHGDYGAVPPALRGPIDRAFHGTHSVLYHSLNPVTAMVRVGDGLNDAWAEWPEHVARAYMEGFPGAGLTYLTVDPREAAASVSVANVRHGPGRSFAVVGTITPKDRVHFGGTVLGEAVGTNRTWLRVHFKGQVAYMHSSVARTA